MRIMLLGSPGVGKGTQAQFIGESFGIPQISTGNILRAAVQSHSELGLSAKKYTDRGELVPDDVICAVVKERLEEADCAKGFLLDGFPRTIPQAQALEKIGVALDYVIVLEAPSDDIVKRLSGRRIHQSSGRTYNIYFQPPKTPNQDDITGDSLIQRDDDQEDVVRHRLSVYEKQTLPLIDFYQQQSKKDKVKIAFVSGLGNIHDVKATILKILKG